MPVVLVSGALLASVEPVLAAVNSAVAGGLGLRACDVYSAFSPAAAALLGDAVVPPWPVAMVHGSARAPELMDAALAAVREVLASAWDRPSDAVWAQWVVSG